MPVIIPHAAKVTYNQTQPRWKIQWADGQSITDMDLKKQAADDNKIRRIHDLIVELTQKAR